MRFTSRARWHSEGIRALDLVNASKQRTKINASSFAFYFLSSTCTWRSFVVRVQPFPKVFSEITTPRMVTLTL